MTWEKAKERATIALLAFGAICAVLGVIAVVILTMIFWDQPTKRYPHITLYRSYHGLEAVIIEFGSP